MQGAKIFVTPLKKELYVFGAAGIISFFESKRSTRKNFLSKSGGLDKKLESQLIKHDEPGIYLNDVYRISSVEVIDFDEVVVPFNYSEGISEGLNILIAKAIDEGISKGISEGIKDVYLKVIEVLIKKGSLKVSQIAEEIDKPAKTIERYVSFLKGIGAIEFEGSKKTGGYKVTDSLLKLNH